MSQTKAQLLDGKSATIQFTGGSVSAPAVSFTGDTNTGIYSPGADQVAISTGGSQRVTVDSTGRLLVGTATATGNRITVLGSQQSVIIRNAVDSDYNELGVWDGSSDGLKAVIKAEGGIAKFGSRTNSPVAIQVNDSERVRVDTSGRVGIGITSPTYVLDVSGGAANGIRYQNTANSIGIQLGASSSSAQVGSTSSHPVEFLVGSVERGRFDTSGRFLVGTSTGPSDSTLVLQGNSSNATFNSVLRMLRNVTNPAADTVLGSIIYGVGSAASAGIECYADAQWAANDYPGRLVLSTTADGASSPTERLRITSSGRVGIGTTSPGNINTTEVTSDNDGIRVQLAATPVAGQGPRLIFGHNTNNGTQQIFAAIKSLMASGNDANWNSDLAFYTGGTSLAERVRIDSSGRLLVGTSSGSYKFQINALGSTGFAFDDVNAAISNTFGTGGNLMLRAQVASSSGGGEIYLGGSTRGDGNVNAIVFSTANSERMRIGSTGKVWLNSTDASFGQFQIGNTTSDGECSIGFIPGVTQFGSGATSTNGDSVIWIIGPNVYGVGASQFAIGNKGVANYVAKLASNTATSWTFSSDERLKNIEGPIIAATQIIEAINPVYYSFKTDPAATRKVGLIAQNVLSVLPEVVDVPEEEQNAEGNQQYMGLAMTDLVPVLIAALKESNLKIKQLTDRVTALESA